MGANRTMSPSEPSEPSEQAQTRRCGESSGGWLERIRHTGRAFRCRNYRLFFAGQSVSVAGRWMQQAAQAWLVYRLTGSEILLGTVGFAGQIMTFLLAPLAGTAADRWDRRRIVVLTQALQMVQALAMTVLTWLGVIEVWHIVALSAALGLVSAFDIPARQALVVDMVEDKADLPNAIALNSFMVNGGKVLGPGVAGVLIGYLGEASCFLVNAVSYLAVLAALLAMRIAPRPPRLDHGRNVAHVLREGFAYAWNTPAIRSILLLLASVSLVGMSYTTLMPVFAKDVLHGGPRTQGWLLASTGAGALVGAVFLASRRSSAGLERVIALAPSLLGVGLIAFSMSKTVWLSMTLLLLAGVAVMLQAATSNTLLQSLVDDSKRGRVMSFYTMAFMGMGPFGSLLMGGLAHWLGAPRATAICGVVCIAASAAFLAVCPSIGRAVRDAATPPTAR